ncbi:MAG: thiamine-monophosphate kinase [Litoreibacter sp.]|nr:thiamine-monophosphate kinase [Litoreibacter sp.]
MSTLKEMGEHEVVRRLTARLGAHAELMTGAGDDCAVVRLADSPIDQVYTTDPLVEGVHFKAGEKSERVGNKAAGRVLSDLAAMGAHPRWLLVNVVAPADQQFEDLENIYKGMNALCARFGAVIIGGDVARGPVLELHLFGIGELPAGTALLRSGARPGDEIFVSGPLGCSIEGRHLDFTPRVEEGIFLRESGMVHALIDVSDGVATDLRHILKQSATGALLDADLIPCNGTLENALYDGEDFELLGTVAPDASEMLRLKYAERFGSELTVIGRMTGEAGVLKLRDGKGVRTLEAKAFEHFKNVPEP